MEAFVNLVEETHLLTVLSRQRRTFPANFDVQSLDTYTSCSVFVLLQPGGMRPLFGQTIRRNSRQVKDNTNTNSTARAQRHENISRNMEDLSKRNENLAEILFKS